MARTPQATEWFRDPNLVEAPRAEALNDKKYRRRGAFITAYVVTAVCLFPLALFAVVGLAVRKPVAVASAGSAVNGPAVAPAEATLRAWLGQRPSPVPNGTILAWAGSQSVPTYAPPKGAQQTSQTVPYQTVIEKFSVVDGSGNIYTASVEMVGEAGLYQAIGTPSLIPDPPATSLGSAVSSPWPGLMPGGSPSSALQAAVTGWADAYASGSSSQLALAVGDPNTSDYYVPLSGVSQITASVGAVAQIGDPSLDDAVAQVSLQILWNGQSIPQGASMSDLPPITLDLLIGRATTAAPVVLAWGPPGSGPTLHAYENAFTGYSASGAQPPTSAPSTTSTAPSTSSPATVPPSTTSLPHPKTTTITTPTTHAPSTTRAGG